MAGNSVLVWARKTRAEKIIAIDVEAKRIQEVKRATTHYPQVKALVADGIEFIGQYRGTIDLLYLDFWVSEPKGTVWGTGRAEAYLNAYTSARDAMNTHSMILIDDTDHVHPWKHTYIVPEARKDGFKVVHEGRQTLLKR